MEVNKVRQSFLRRWAKCTFATQTSKQGLPYNCCGLRLAGQRVKRFAQRSVFKCGTNRWVVTRIQSGAKRKRLFRIILKNVTKLNYELMLSSEAENSIWSSFLYHGDHSFTEHCCLAHPIWCPQGNIKPWRCLASSKTFHRILGDLEMQFLPHPLSLCF